MANYFGEVLGKYLDKLVVLRGCYRGGKWWEGYNFMPLDKCDTTNKTFNTVEEIEQYIKDNYDQEQVNNINIKRAEENTFEEFWMPRHLFFSQPQQHDLVYGRDYFRNRYRDWFEDFEYENGQYENKCVTCENTFVGNKGRVVCKLCYYGKQDPNNVKVS